MYLLENFSLLSGLVALAFFSDLSVYDLSQPFTHLGGVVKHLLLFLRTFLVALLDELLNNVVKLLVEGSILVLGIFFVCLTEDFMPVSWVMPDKNCSQSYFVSVDNLLRFVSALKALGV